MNRVFMIGRLTSDPEVRYTQDRKPVIRFRFAVNRSVKKEGEAEADFFACVLLGRTAERFERLNVQKGVKLMIEGEVRNNNYTDKNGVKRFENQLLLNNFEFCESKNASPSAPNVAAPSTSADGFQSVPDDVSDEGLPFA